MLYIAERTFALNSFITLKFEILLVILLLYVKIKMNVFQALRSVCVTCCVYNSRLLGHGIFEHQKSARSSSAELP